MNRFLNKLGSKPAVAVVAVAAAVAMTAGTFVFQTQGAADVSNLLGAESLGPTPTPVVLDEKKPTPISSTSQLPNSTPTTNTGTQAGQQNPTPTSSTSQLPRLIFRTP